MNNGYEDDLTISNEDVLWRRISPLDFVHDENSGRIQPSSNAFRDHPSGTPMSVSLAAETTAVEVLDGHPRFALAGFTAGFARGLKQGITRRPLPEDPAHAEVFGRKTRSVRKRLAMESDWVVPPE